MAALIQTRTPLPELRAAAREQGMKLLLDSGMDKVRDGITSLEEVLTVAIERGRLIMAFEDWFIAHARVSSKPHRKVSMDDKMTFFHQLATLISSGTPIFKAVMKAYEHLLPPDAMPSYFIYFETDPESIDINIHPTKTEIKFEDEQSIFQILVASLKESLGRSNITPSIDFNIDTSVDIPVLRKTDEIRMPVINVNPYYNPFEQPSSNQDNYRLEYEKVSIPDNWETLYSGNKINKADTEIDNQTLISEDEVKISSFTFQLKNKYIVTNVKSGLMMIDQKRAHERILFEHFIAIINNSHGVTQKSLFPKKVDFTLNEINCLMEIFDDIRALGFEIEFVNETQIAINGYPADIDLRDPERLLHHIIASFTNETLDIETGRREKIAKEMAIAGAVPYGTILKPEEMKDLVDHLFACETPNYSPSGKLIISIINLEEIEHRF